MIERLLSNSEAMRLVLEFTADEAEIGSRIIVKTGVSIFVLEPTRRTDFGTLHGNVTRFSEVPLTSESGAQYLPDVMITGQECFLFSGQELKVGESMYFHGIRYEGHRYSDDDSDVIYTAPIESIAIEESLNV